jgi:hypothetical protein
LRESSAPLSNRFGGHVAVSAHVSSGSHPIAFAPIPHASNANPKVTQPRRPLLAGLGVPEWKFTERKFVFMLNSLRTELLGAALELKFRPLNQAAPAYTIHRVGRREMSGRLIERRIGPSQHCDRAPKSRSRRHAYESGATSRELRKNITKYVATGDARRSRRYFAGRTSPSARIVAFASAMIRDRFLGTPHRPDEATARVVSSMAKTCSRARRSDASER